MKNRNSGKIKWEEIIRNTCGVDNMSRRLEFYTFSEKLEKIFILNVNICRFTDS